MTQKEKEMVFRDLCARLPYRPFVELDEEFVYDRGTKVLSNTMLGDLTNVSHIKPYLRPMSSMTDEEYEEYCKTLVENDFGNPEYDTYETFDFLNSIHVDYRNLIPRGLAFEAKEGMYKTR